MWKAITNSNNHNQGSFIRTRREVFPSLFNPHITHNLFHFG